jgi:hypothetical protein
LIGLYQNGEIKYAIFSRSRSKGEQLVPEDLSFVSGKEIEQILQNIDSAPSENDASPLAKIEHGAVDC